MHLRAHASFEVLLAIFIRLVEYEQLALNT